MNNIHTKAFLTNFELACEWSLLITLMDAVWLTHDVIYNGWNTWYVVIATGFVFGISGILHVMYKHHKMYTHRLLRKNKKVKSKFELFQEFKVIN